MDFLTRPLIFLDIEATGLNVIRDRIVQIGMIKYFPGERESQELDMLINPGIPISAEAMGVHGITPKDLANKPTFAQVSEKLFEFIGSADLAGYNSNRFDVPMLMEEFARVGKEFSIDKRRLIDVQRIFYKMEPRTLRAALKFYCNQEIENAHDALADVRATVEVFKGQLKAYEGKDLITEDGDTIVAPIKEDIAALHEFTSDLRMLDATQKLRYDHNGVVVFNFGKYINQPAAEVLVRDKNYYHWILNKEFSSQVKQIVKKLVKDYEKENQG
jgi:DNA polymerase-3 subunit epsilon